MSEIYVPSYIVKPLIEEGYKSFMVNEDGCNECGCVVFKEVKSNYVCAQCNKDYQDEMESTFYD